MKRIGLVLSLGIAVALVLPDASHAQVRFGPQASYGDDSDFGVGARVVLDVPSVVSGAQLHGSFDYFFIDGAEAFGITADAAWWEVNANAVYGFDLSASDVTPYVGGGLNLAHVSGDVSNELGTLIEFSDTEVGLNLLGGAQFPTGSITPFAELRIELGGGEQFVLTGGLLFP